MNRWATIVFALALVAAAAWVATGVYGFRVIDRETFALHALVAYGALLALVLTQAWFALFALASRALVRRAVGRDTAELVRAARAILAASLLAIAACAAHFTASSALFPSGQSARTHALAALGSLVALVVALAVEARSLRLHARAAARLEPERVLD